MYSITILKHDNFICGNNDRVHSTGWKRNIFFYRWSLKFEESKQRCVWNVYSTRFRYKGRRWLWRWRHWAHPMDRSSVSKWLTARQLCQVPWSHLQIAVGLPLLHPLQSAEVSTEGWVHSFWFPWLLCCKTLIFFPPCGHCMYTWLNDCQLP